jgi:hypothetical protein
MDSLLSHDLKSVFFGAVVVAEQDIAACGAAQTFGVIEHEWCSGCAENGMRLSISALAGCMCAPTGRLASCLCRPISRCIAGHPRRGHSGAT